MNTPENHWEHNIELIGQTCDIIKERLAESRARFDIFAFLPSSTVWQSPVELARTWIEGVAPEAWKYIQDLQSDTLAEKLVKYTFRRSLIESAAITISILGRHPTTLQRMSTRLFIQQILVTHLPVYIQDRILATEFGTSLRTWQQILGIFSTHTELSALLEKSTPFNITINTEWNPLCMLIHSEFHPSIDIPGVTHSTEQTIGMISQVWGSLAIWIKKIWIVHITQNALKRYDDILWMDDTKNTIRKYILESTQIPAWKRRGGWWNKPKESHVPDGKLVY
jgi:hypothetical protein